MHLTITKRIYFFLLLVNCADSIAQLGNRILPAKEAAFFSVTSIQNGFPFWSTMRANTPGYFSLVGDGTFTGYNDTFNVDGYVKYYQNGSSTTKVVIPVGSGNDLRLISVENIPTNAVFAASWIVGDPSYTLDPTDNAYHDIYKTDSILYYVSPLGYWDWLDISGTMSGAIVKVSIPDHTGYGLPNDLRLMGWKDTSWVLLSGVGSATGTTENSTVTGIVQAGISAIGIGYSSLILPLSGVQFAVSRLSNCEVSMWCKFNEKETYNYFDLETSLDGASFNANRRFYKKDGRITDNNIVHASRINTEHEFFRIKKYGLDNSIRYSDIIQIKPCTKKFIATPFCNPVRNGECLIENVNSDRDYEVSIRVFSQAGVLIMSRADKIFKGKSQLKTQLNGLSVGSYFIVIYDVLGNQVLAKHQFLKL